ncbi:MAG: sulfotransferase [Candidatus Thiodiazotropha sp.]
MPYQIIDSQGISDRRIKGFHLDTPLPGQSDSANKITIAGWILSASEAFTHVEIREHDRGTSYCIQRCPIAVERPDVVNHYQDHSLTPRCGFSSQLMLLGLPQRAELSLHAITESGEGIPFLRLNLERKVLVSDFSPRLRPVIVTTLGRTGSTWFMQLLSKHPSVVVADQHPYETFALEFWLHLVTQQLVSPENLLSPVDQKRFQRDFVALPERKLWFDQEYHRQALRFCQQSIENYYLSVAQAQGAASTQFFAEKIPYFSGEGNMTWRQLGAAVRELYPDALEIVLVRDFRDMILSALHFGAQDKSPSDLEKEKSTAYLNVVKEVSEFSAYYQQNRSNTLLVRYEDLMLDTQAILKRVFQSLGVACDAQTMDHIIRDKHAVAQEHKQHITSKSIAQSVQRWRSELTPQLQDRYTEMFEQQLQLFGYDIRLS